VGGDDAVGAVQFFAAGDGRGRTIGAEAIDCGLAAALGAGLGEAGGGGGDEDLAILARRDVVEEGGAGHGPLALGGAAAAVEEADGVDVGDVERVAVDRHALGRVQRDTLGLAVDPAQLADLAIGRDAGDEAVAILGAGVAVDIRDEIDIALLVVQR